MTVVKFMTRGSILSGYHVHGHAESENVGESIICAAISSAVYLTANTITDILHIDADIQVNEDENDNENIFSCLVSKEDAPQCSVVLEGLRLHLTALSQQYPENIKLTTMEV